MESDQIDSPELNGLAYSQDHTAQLITPTDLFIDHIQQSYFIRLLHERHVY